MQFGGLFTRLFDGTVQCILWRPVISCNPQTENRHLYLLLHVTPSPLHKQCPAIPLTSRAANFATRARTCRACGPSLNSLPSPTGQRSRSDSPSKLHLSFSLFWYNLSAFVQLSSTDHSITSHYLFSQLPIDIVRGDFTHLMIIIIIITTTTIIGQVPLTTQSTWINILSLDCW